ncbi:trans-2,3-dihydro-3-hydroxyanthranilate isomerase [Rhizobiales bacterium GAS191]|jgi:trans-2,3-dihydro-3-hydroxyanthranilate isomerase|nr:trans-2,3-dihydro-3-hydroxyanthranilate isomerase [Rhizobiales bacterium GAS113]SEC05575.1 trans-2,3-dihydro-3-hydroxyanthranilate isomerase [Rhizobiales bacterium GAS191]SED14118.1 trans-2,3-dihydro-3-hydroxyanthranilate isomerase [Rhizobiales bacterium GAS188]
MPRRFYTLDVFAGEVLAGNPLAVVLDAQGLDDRRMLAIAGEFNLSETVFVGAPAQASHRASLRIFTPGRELPFAGHPTVGTAVLLALLDRRGEPGKLGFDLEEKIGLVPCTVEVTGAERGRAVFTVPRLPERLGALPDKAALARGLGLEESDIGFGAHEPGIFSAGVGFACVPLRSRDAVTRARPQGEAFAKAFAAVGDPNAYVYCAEPLDQAHAYHVRMFAPGFGIAEDPATGSAAAAFAGVIMQFDKPKDGDHAFVIEQGDAMGRPSRITLWLDVAEGRLRQARIDGEAVIMSEGQIRA